MNKLQNLSDVHTCEGFQKFMNVNNTYVEHKISFDMKYIFWSFYTVYRHNWYSHQLVNYILWAAQVMNAAN